MASLSPMAKQARRFDRDRFLCALAAPGSAREALFALLAFNLELARIREAVSDVLLGCLRLKWWEDSLDSIFDGRPPRHPVAEALAAAAESSGLTSVPLRRQIEARSLDMANRPPVSLAELESYAKGTAGALAEATLQVLGVTDEMSHKAAVQVGTAWGLTGLMRAAPFHAAQGRSYLPDSLVLEGRRETAVAQVAKVAQDHLVAARGARNQVSERALPALLPAVPAQIHLNRLEKAGYDPGHVAIARPIGPLGIFRLGLSSFLKRY